MYLLISFGFSTSACTAFIAADAAGYSMQAGLVHHEGVPGLQAP
jgi:hypothetical protein